MEIGSSKSLDDSVIVVGSYSPHRSHGFETASSNPKSSLDSKSKHQRKHKTGNLATATSNSILEDSVIILDDDNSKTWVPKHLDLDGTVIVLDSDEEIEEKVISPGNSCLASATCVTKENTKSSTVVAGNVVKRCLDFIPLSSNTALQTRGKRIDSSAIGFTPSSSNLSFRPQASGSELGKPAIENSKNVNRSHSVQTTLEMRQKSTLCRFSEFSSPMDVEPMPSPTDCTVRKVCFNPKLGDGGSLTATLKFPNMSSETTPPRSNRKKKKKVNAAPNAQKGQQNREQDSYRHFMGISEKSKTWLKNQKNKCKKAAMRQSAELDLTKVVLGIRNLNSEHNASADVVEFTSGKSPRTAFGGRANFDQRVPEHGTNPQNATVISDLTSGPTRPINDNAVFVVPTANSSENTAPGLKSAARGTADVIVLDNPSSSSDRRVAMINPTQQSGIQIMFSNISKANINVNQKCTKPLANNRLPPPSPHTLLQNCQYYGLAVDGIRSSFMPQIPAPICIQSVLRPIAIDGSNVAYTHGKHRYYSCRGIQLCIEFFQKRGHKVVRAFVPQFRRSKSLIIKDQEILEKLGQGDSQTIVFTPSRKVNNVLITSYDDRFIVEYAVQSGAVMVSNDNYRDIMTESRAFREAIEKRLLMYTFVDDLFMVPQDPLGRQGPCLDKFLTFD